MDAYRWRYLLLAEAMREIAETGDLKAQQALESVDAKCRSKARRDNQLLTLLAEKPLTFEGMLLGMGMTRVPVLQIIRRLHDARKVYVHSYLRDTSRKQASWRKVWAAGDKPDAVFVPVTPRQAGAKPRKAAKEKVKYVKPPSPSATPVRDPLIAALFGASR